MNTLYIIMAVLCFYLADAILTYISVKKYQSLSPNKDWTLCELSPVLRFSWKKFGLLKGSLIVWIPAFFILTILLLILPCYFAFGMFGAYVVVLWIHFYNLLYYYKLSKNDNN